MGEENKWRREEAEKRDRLVREEAIARETRLFLTSATVKTYTGSKLSTKIQYFIDEIIRISRCFHTNENMSTMAPPWERKVAHLERMENTASSHKTLLETVWVWGFFGLQIKGNAPTTRVNHCFLSQTSSWEMEDNWCATSMQAARQGARGGRRVNKIPTRKQKMRLKETFWP